MDVVGVIQQCVKRGDCGEDLIVADLWVRARVFLDAGSKHAQQRASVPSGGGGRDVSSGSPRHRL
jgi:hypothetical protein